MSDSTALKTATHWKTQIEQYHAANKSWTKRGEDIIKRYRDERGDQNNDGSMVARRMSSLWSNVSIMEPALYGKKPIPICERRFKDRDPVARVAATMLERALRNEIEISDFNLAIQQALKDRLLPGRGTVWVRYEPTFEAGPSIPSATEGSLTDADDEPIEGDDYDSEETEKLESTGDRIVRESVPVDYVNWKDFYTLPPTARTWQEVQAVGKRVFMDREALIKKFGKKIGGKFGIPLMCGSNGDVLHARNQEYLGKGEMTAIVYEIWCKYDQTVYWVAEGYDELCDKKADPLRLENFFPCPMPLYASMTTDNLQPVADYIEYQDQAREIDDLTQRLTMLTRACKVAGAYDASSKPLGRLLDESVENSLIPVDSWAAFAEKGGLQGAIAFLPLKEIVETIKVLAERRSMAMQDMDRITGITDIMRGTSDSRESMGGQRLKSNSANTRLSRQQNEVARFCRDTICIMAEIISEHFQPDTLIEVSGVMYEDGIVADPPSPMIGHNGGPPLASGTAPLPPQAGPPMGTTPPPPPVGMPPAAPIDPEKAKLERVKQAIELLKNEKLRGFRVDIETDSTVAGDSEQEKSQRIEFIKAVTDFMKAGAEIAAQEPSSVPLLGKLLQFGARGFRVGRDLEASIEEFVDEAEKNAKARAANPPPNPEQVKAETEKMKAQAEIQAQQIEAASEQKNAELDLQAKAMDQQIAQLKAQSDAQEAAHEQEMDRRKVGLESERVKIDYGKLELERQKTELEHHRLNLDAQDKAAKHDTEGKRLKMDSAKKADELRADEGEPSESSKMMDAFKNLTDGLSQHMKALEQMHKQAMAPKKIVRDPKTNRAIGLETTSVH